MTETRARHTHSESMCIRAISSFVLNAIELSIIACIFSNDFSVCSWIVKVKIINFFIDVLIVAGFSQLKRYTCDKNTNSAFISAFFSTCMKKVVNTLVRLNQRLFTFYFKLAEKKKTLHDFSIRIEIANKVKWTRDTKKNWAKHSVRRGRASAFRIRWG